MTEPELRINGNNRTREDFGVRMGVDFLSTLSEPLSLKQFIENEARTENGVRVTLSPSVFISARELTLEFVLVGNSPNDLATKKAAFLSEVYKGAVDIQVPALGDEVFHLLYLGKGSTYGLSLDRCTCKISLKFKEPNPANRSYGA